MKLLYAGFIALGLVGCTALDRQGIVNDVGKYSGAPAEPDGSYKPGKVATEVGKDVLDQVSTPYGLAIYVGGLLTVIAAGWVKRRVDASTEKKAETIAAKVAEKATKTT